MSIVKCPQCGKKTNFSKENLHRPFCCERCQILDLGSWADEEFKIPTNEYGNPIQKEKEEAEDEDFSSFNPLLH